MGDYDLYDDEELYEDEEEQAVEEEGTNRTFVILAVALGGLLLVTVCIFLVWAFVINPGRADDLRAQNEAIAATNEAMLAAAGILTDTVAAEDVTVEPDTSVPTDVPEPTDAVEPPTATPSPAATATPVPDTPTPSGDAEVTPSGDAETTPSGDAEVTPEEAGEAATEEADAAATEAPDTTPEETVPAEVADVGEAAPTPAATPTPRRDKAGVPETGIGVLGASALAIGLLFLLMLVRRMRRAV